MKNSLSHLLVLTAALLTQSGRADTLTVTITADDPQPDSGSLRAVIAAANWGDTIDFAVTGVITLTQGELGIEKDLTILGPGSDSLMIQRSLEPGTADFRIFHLLYGTIGISGLTVNNGRSDLGGGIFNEVGSVLMRDVTVSGNSATSAGGGVYNAQGDM